MKEQDHPKGGCLYCVHCRLTDRVNPKTKERIYECLMMEKELTQSHWATDCPQCYTGTDE
jgi:hypothetical protein